jgi:alpha-L-fucosidase
MGFKELRDASFRSNLCVNAVATLLDGDQIKSRDLINDNDPNTFVNIDDIEKEKIKIHFKKPAKINCIVLKEFIKDGQSVQKFSIVVQGKDKSESFTHTTIGHKRIITFPAREADDIIIYILESKGKVKLAEAGAYLIREDLVEKPSVK